MQQITITTTRRMMSKRAFSSVSSSYDKFSAALEASNVSVFEHVQHNSSANIGKCPFLRSDERLMRTALRESNARSYSRKLPLDIATGDGVYLTDVNGSKYMDCLACAGTLALGHSHPVIVKAMHDFIDSKQPLQTLDLVSPVKDAFITTVLEALPAAFAENARLQFCGPSGSDCVEAALKLAKYATGRSGILSFHGAYHGHGHGTLALMGNLGAKQHLPNVMAGVQFLPYPYAYRCPMNIGADGWKTIVAYIENMLNDVESGVPLPAAMVLEAVQGEGGVIPANDEFLRHMRRICSDKGIVMIVDEIQTGWGRTGDMFAHESSGIVPDVITLSKAIGGGLPMAVMAYDRQLEARAQHWAPGAHAGTFRGNQMAMATGTAAIKHIMEGGIIGNVRARSAQFKRALSDMKAKMPFIGDLRMRGLMIGVELVDTSAPADALGAHPSHTDLTAEVQQQCFKYGLIVERGGRNGCVLRFLPPLIISESEVNDACAILEQALTAAAAKYNMN